jgi:hypothetical protein
MRKTPNLRLDYTLHSIVLREKVEITPNQSEQQRGSLDQLSSPRRTGASINTHLKGEVTHIRLTEDPGLYGLRQRGEDGTILEYVSYEEALKRLEE